MIAAAPPPPPSIVAAVKAVYPRSPIRIVRICRVGRLAFVHLRVRARDSFVAARTVRRGWKVVWVDGKARTGTTPAVVAAIGTLRTRCLAP